MGVTGLWRLIEPAGKPVPVETLENKVLAVDISIWLHQMVKGYQDAKGAPLPNAHLMGLFQRLCKLLYFRIKPIFVFDGGFPDLKKETIAKRQDSKAKYNSESERIKRELALLLSKKSAISSLLGKEISPKKGSSTNTAINDDLFKLPALPESKHETESESEDEESSSSSTVDLHSIDIESSSFKNLPVKEKYDLLIELKETRKMNSWGKINELPKKSDNFSDFQMQRLLKRRKVQECLEETEKEMGDGGMSLNELESLLNDEGIDTKIEVIPTRRIASSDNTRFLLINNVKQALLDAKKKKELQDHPETSKVSEDTAEKEEKPPIKDELEDDLEKAIKMSLECVDEANTSNYTSKTDDSWTSALTDNDYSDNTDSEDGDGYEQPDMSSAKAYIMQYSDFTNKAIDQLIGSKHPAHKTNSNLSKVDKIIEDINKEKSIIADKIDLSSDEDCSKNHEHDSRLKIQNLDEDELEHSEADVSATQASVLYVENHIPDVITLDTSGEETISDNRNKIENIDDELCTDSQKDKDRSDLSEVHVYNETPIKMESHSSGDEFENVSNLHQQCIVSAESNSSDDEFEDVPEVENQATKPIVQLTLDMDQVCEEDDIFADVFTNKSAKDEITDVKNKHSSHIEIPNSNKDTLPINSIDHDSNKHTNTDLLNTNLSNLSNRINIKEKSFVDFQKVTEKDVLDEDLEKAIKMSLECMKECDSNTIVTGSKAMIEEPTTSQIVSSTDTCETVKEKDVQEKSSNPMKPVQQVTTIEQLTEMAEVVANEEQNLVQEKGRMDRVGRNITEQMTKEAQELLQLFGIPYIVAPMEAEAQCAFLENVKLTDGTITDDSDIWLFGGRTVYKNFFNQKKHVLQFLSEKIEKSFNLTREQLILLALLVGSDYTTGVDGVGPVTAMEILASFPFNKKQLLNETSKQGKYQQIVTGMQEFKSWVRGGKRTDNTSLKKKLRNVMLNDDFPSVRVVQAYLEPNVEKSEDKFSWGEIDITILRDYTKAKFGWSQNKLDEIIKPVLKRLQEKKSQKTMQDYFRRKVEFQSLEHQMSKRVKAAVQKMGPEQSTDEMLLKELEEANPGKASKSKNVRKRTNKDGTSKVKIDTEVAGPSKKIRITTGSELEGLNVRAVTHVEETSSGIDIIIPKTDRFQEIIPQREKDKQCLLQNKMKAIELFRKTKIDKKKKLVKRKVILPKEKADLSESSDGD